MPRRLTATFFWIATKLANKQSSIYHLKMFWILFTRYFCYFTFTVYTNVLNTVVFMVTKGKKKAILKAKPTPLYSNPPPSRNPHTISFWYFFQPPLLIHTPHLLETLEYVFRACVSTANVPDPLNTFDNPQI